MPPAASRFVRLRLLAPDVLRVGILLERGRITPARAALSLSAVARRLGLFPTLSLMRRVSWGSWKSLIHPVLTRDDEFCPDAFHAAGMEIFVVVDGLPPG